MHRPLLSRSHPSPAFPSLLGAKSPSLVANSDFKTDSEIEIVKLYVMVPPPLANLAAEGMYSQLVSEDADLAEDLQSAQEGSMVNFIKALLFRRDIQDQIHLVACMTVREWEAGQRALLSARWLAVSKNWSTVAVCQICLDEITRLKEQLITDSSVRLVQTARLVNTNAMYLSRNAMVVQFNHGISFAKEFLTMEDDCAVVIPLLVPEKCSLSCWDRNHPSNSTKVAFSLSRGYVMSGRTVLSLDSEEPLLCLVFSMAAMKEAQYSTFEVTTQRPKSYA